MSFLQKDGILFMKKIFLTIWYYITLPYYWITTRGVDKKLRKITEEDREAQLKDKEEEIKK